MAAQLSIQPTRFSTAPSPVSAQTGAKPEPEVQGQGQGQTLTNLVATLVTLAALVAFALGALPVR